MTTEWAETVQGIRVPKHIAQMSKGEIVWKVHGIVVGEYRCVNCDRVYMEHDYPSGRCIGCGVPLPRICVTPSCDNRCDPINYTDERGGVQWYDPMLDCGDCQRFSGRAQRSSWIQSITPPHIHEHLGQAYHWAKPGRDRLDGELKQWFVEERCGVASRQVMLYVYGEAGVGKSVGVMFHAARNHLNNRVKGVFYVTESDLLTANGNRYADRREDKEKALSLFAKCSETPLLILDDLGNRDSYRPGQLDMFGRVIGERARLGRPVIVISRRPPGTDGPFAWIPGQLSGAFRHAGRTVAVL